MKDKLKNIETKMLLKKGDKLWKTYRLSKSNSQNDINKQNIIMIFLLKRCY